MKNEILELRKLGFSYNEIAKKLNCSKSTISYHCSKIENNDEKIKNNLKIKNKRQEKNDSFLLQTDKIDEVIELRKELKTYEEIKKITGLSKSAVGKICREYKLIMNRKFSEISNDTKSKIKETYEEVKSTRKVAELLNVSRDSVMNVVSQKRKNQLVKGVVEWRKRVKLKLVDYKGGKCEKCDYSKCVDALEFHHIDPNEKDFTIGGKSWSFDRLKSEVDKCILVCSNCHKEIHFEEKTASTSPS
jgi:DNA invertase Pin-like site-specific DNA recombinase